MKDIFTVTLFFGRYLTTVSFTKQEDAIAYAADEIVRKFPDEDKAQVKEKMEYQLFWKPKEDLNGDDDFVSVDPAKLCNSYESDKS